MGGLQIQLGTSGFNTSIDIPTILEFLSAFKEAFTAAFIEQNIKIKSDNWTSKTPQTIRELNFQTEHIKNRILKAEVKALQAANEQKKRRERKRKRRIMQGGSLSVRDAEDILQTAEVDAQIRSEVASESSRQVGSKGRQKRCSLCGIIGHNSHDMGSCNSEPPDSDFSSAIFISEKPFPDFLPVGGYNSGPMFEIRL
ncbi:hypothetical protein V500_01567 [Pseudogymnoascus sp. VKM F-4518 (FW-2643)]|nr:hypothetical protein V500_01567 [Pseudogymnoascus sp. VKM F-4518 (FW-2643)]